MPKVGIGDIQLFYDVHTASEGGGESVLFLHGLGGSSRDWEQQIPAFEDRYRVVTADLRGHGESDRPANGPYSITQMAQDVIMMMDIFRLGSAHIIGHSLGGRVALQLAISHPSRLKSLILVNSGPQAATSGLSGLIRQWVSSLTLRFRGVKGMGQMLARQLFPKPEQEVVRQRFIQTWQANDPQAYRAITRAISGWNMSSHLEKINLPVLVIASDHDFESVISRQTYASKLPKASIYIFRDAHHAPHLEYPEIFNQVARDFVDTYTDRPMTPSQRPTS